MEEREYKFLIDQNTFNELYKRFQTQYTYTAKRVLQINYYYDTDSLYFNSIGETIRIRQIDDQLTGTIKSHISNDGSGLSVENSFKIDSLSRVLHYKSKDIYFHGQLVTERTALYLSNNIIVFFDKNYYLGTVDYEVELEYLCSSESNALHWYLSLSEFIREREAVIKKRNSKSNRFFKKKKAMLY